MKERNRKLKPSTILVHFLLLVLVFINIFPLYWMLTFSLKTNDEILGYSYKDPETGVRVQVAPNHVGLHHQWEWSNYAEAMNTGNMGLYFVNSLVVAVSAIAITMVASFMATYALTRLVWKVFHAGPDHPHPRLHRAGIHHPVPDEPAQHLFGADLPLRRVLPLHGHSDFLRFYGRYSL